MNTVVEVILRTLEAVSQLRSTQMIEPILAVSMRKVAARAAGSSSLLTPT